MQWTSPYRRDNRKNFIIDDPYGTISTNCSMYNYLVVRKGHDNEYFIDTDGKLHPFWRVSNKKKPGHTGVVPAPEKEVASPACKLSGFT